MQTGDSEKLKSVHLGIKDGHAINSHLEILQTSSSFKPYVFLSRNYMGSSRTHGDSELHTSFHSDIKDGQALSSHLEMLHTSSSPTKSKWRLRIAKIIQFRSYPEILQTTSSSKSYVLFCRNLMGYQRWPCTKQPS